MEVFMARCSDCYSYHNGYCEHYYQYVQDYGGSYYDLRDYASGVVDAINCPNFIRKSDNSGSGCFLTSALVRYLGKTDDCEELTILRSFRDGYMRSFEEGRKLVGEYYIVAPKIVKAIEASGKKDEYYQDINNVVNDCVKAIKLGDNEKTMSLYCDMVNKYKALI